jgi:hypothetical protein
MKYYQGYWPILAIIKQYLSNVKKRLAEDLKAEKNNHSLPGEMKAQKKPQKRHSSGSDAESDEESKVDEQESEVEKESDDMVEESDEDEVDSEDDRAEMEMYEYYGSGRKNAQEDDDGPRTDHRKIAPVKKSVE